MKRILQIAIMMLVSVSVFAQRRDSIVVRTDTMKTVEIVAEKDLQVMDVLNKTIGRAKKSEVKTKKLSDYINSDYILHPFSMIKERRKANRRKKMMKYLREYDQVKTFEEALTERIRQQLYEDSIKGVVK